MPFQPPAGYRLLEAGEVIQEGDLYDAFGLHYKWSEMIGVVRRRIGTRYDPQGSVPFCRQAITVTPKGNRCDFSKLKDLEKQGTQRSNTNG